MWAICRSELIFELSYSLDSPLELSLQFGHTSHISIDTLLSKPYTQRARWLVAVALDLPTPACHTCGTPSAGATRRRFHSGPSETDRYRKENIKSSCRVGQKPRPRWLNRVEAKSLRLPVGPLEQFESKRQSIERRVSVCRGATVWLGAELNHSRRLTAAGNGPSKRVKLGTLAAPRTESLRRLSSKSLVSLSIYRCHSS